MNSQKESLKIGAPSNPETSPTGLVIYREFAAPRPVSLPNTISLESLSKEYDNDPEKLSRLSAARKNLSKVIYDDDQETLSYLRLAAGLSQQQLAEKVGTSQPHIARIERGQHDPSTGLISRIAKALNVDEGLTFRAIRNQLNTRDSSE